jgi:hypothetical protein
MTGTCCLYPVAQQYRSRESGLPFRCRMPEQAHHYRNYMVNNAKCNDNLNVLNNLINHKFEKNLQNSSSVHL